MSQPSSAQPDYSIAQTVMRLSIIVSLTLAIYLLLIMPFEYLLTEHFLITPFITPNLKTGLLFLTLIIVCFIFSLKTDIKLTFKHMIFSNIVFGLLLISNIFYNRHYNYLQTYPKIFSLSSDWSIQGMAIKIKGKNFGDQWQSGKVKVGDIEYLISRWSNLEIVARQPVPNQFILSELKVIKYNGKESEGLPFEVRDPVFLAPTN